MQAYHYIKENIDKISERIENAVQKSGRSAADIKLVAVTKTVEVQKIQAAIGFGIQNLGENRVQEYIQKKVVINGKIFWHLIGQMQSNKVKYIIGGVSLLQSLDRTSLAQEIDRQCEKEGQTLDALIEINIAGEQTKAGVDIGQLDMFLESLSAYPHVRVKGLMTVAPYTTDKSFLRSCFAKMYKQYERLKDARYKNIEMQYLSMGMSGDFEEAILEGSNMLRIGSAIFGERSK